MERGCVDVAALIGVFQKIVHRERDKAVAYVLFYFGVAEHIGTHVFSHFSSGSHGNVKYIPVFFHLFPYVGNNNLNISVTVTPFDRG